jgi:predicted TIM-barrel fold metal-dependent hydrolase
VSAPPRIVDSHTHYIEPDRPGRPYVNKAAMHPLSFDEIAAGADAAGIDRVVQVTASTMGDDNRYSFEGFEARPDKVLGVVGRFDPIASRVRERLKEYREQPGALGIRLTLFHDWSRPWLRDRALDPFLDAAAELDVPVCIHAPGQTRELLATVQRHPAVRFIVDHMNIRHEPGMTAPTAFGEWPVLRALATRPNTWIKVSYFPEAAMGSEKFPYPTAQRRFRELYDEAGAARLVWGSNYPVVTRACGWREALDFMRVECDFLAPADRDAILGGNFLRDFA